MIESSSTDPTTTESNSQANRLRITEIFYSIQGESRTIGKPTIFIRLTGCPLRCGYCDTDYAFSGGEWMSFDEILDSSKQYNTRYITVTGGEPLAQKNCIPLLRKLCDAGYEVSLETSGALDISSVDERVSRVMDIKTPGSQEMEKNRLDNIQFLTANDQIKFVICNRQDYEWSVSLLREKQIADLCEVIFSPSYEQLSLKELTEWVLADQLPVRVQCQLHKIIWGEEPGH